MLLASRTFAFADSAGSQRMAVLGIHRDVFDDRVVPLARLVEGAGKVLRQPQFEHGGVVFCECEPRSQIARHLIEDRLAPVDLECSRLRGVHEVVAQCPGDQDVRVSERDRQAQSR